MPSFADLGLPAALVRALAAEGFTAPFPVQAATLPDSLAGRDVLGRGQTGSGKTLAFGLALLARLDGTRAAPRRPSGLVLVPTRELAQQVVDALEPFAAVLGLRVQVVVGGLSMHRQVTALERGTHLLVATPGRLTDLLEQGACDLGDIAVTAIDEADRMADMGFLPQVRRILDRTPADGQRLLFSATLDGDVAVLVQRYLHDPVTRAVASPTAQVETMDHHVLVVEAADKPRVIAEIAARTGRTILFVRTKHGADRLVRHLRRDGVLAGALHGGKAQNARNRAIAAFAAGEPPVLVATDVAARGIHIDEVSLVVHVDPPADPKDYLHRAGRTARAGDTGTVVTMATPEQRGDVDALTRKAGVRATVTEVAPGGSELVRITGARAGGVPEAERPAAATPAPLPARSGRGAAAQPAGRQRAGQRSRRSARAEQIAAPAAARGADGPDGVAGRRGARATAAGGRAGRAASDGRTTRTAVADGRTGRTATGGYSTSTAASDGRTTRTAVADGRTGRTATGGYSTSTAASGGRGGRAAAGEAAARGAAGGRSTHTAASGGLAAHSARSSHGTRPRRRRGSAA